MTRSIVFIIDLVQDVNTLRPLMALARRETAHELVVIASTSFDKIDATGQWRRELREICGILAIPVYRFAGEFEAVQLLQRRSGLLISASESDARAHARSHELFRAAPPGFVKVTLQHGFECLGFLHNAAHDRAHGQYASFNADIICGWFGGGLLRSVSPVQSAKLVVTGPPLLIDCGTSFNGIARVDAVTGTEQQEPAEGVADATGEPRPACLVCENLHSVRLGSDALKSGFLGQFSEFSAAATVGGWDVWLRPHPAGRFTDIKGIALPDGVRKSSGPIYKEDLRRFSLAISAPSSILFDFIMAGVPVAVWQDEEGGIDCRNYPWLPVVSRVEEWLAFADLVKAGAAALVRRQQELVASLAMPGDVTASYLRLLRSIA